MGFTIPKLLLINAYVGVGKKKLLSTLRVLLADLMIKETWHRLIEEIIKFNYIHMYGNLTHMRDTNIHDRFKHRKGKWGILDILS